MYFRLLTNTVIQQQLCQKHDYEKHYPNLTRSTESVELPRQVNG